MPWIGTCPDGLDRGCHGTIRMPSHSTVKRRKSGLPLLRKQPLTPFESYDHRETKVSRAFSSTYWEVPFCPCVFNTLLGDSFIFNIFIVFALCFQQLIGRFHLPFIFNKLAEANCAFKISWCRVIFKESGGVGVTSAGVTVMRRAFIALLAYTYWLEKSRDKVSFVSSDALGPTYEFPSGSHTQGGWSLRRPANGESLR